MADPKTVEEYNELSQKNSSVSGYGPFEARMHCPCPFCAAPDFSSWLILEVAKLHNIEFVCKACGRGAVMIFTSNSPDFTQFEMVQTRGNEPAEYLPKMRRDESLQDRANDPVVF